MNSFVSKQILTSQTIGECLRKAREGACFSIENVSFKIGIKERYLSAIEIGLYSELPGEVYALEFIKKYATFLRMDPSVAGQAYKKERKQLIAGNYQLSAHGASYKALKSSKIFSRALVSVGIFLALVYGFIFSKGLFSQPNISITTPDEYFNSSSSHITLQGIANHAKEVRVNGEEINLSKDGAFIESFNLPQGMTILRIDAKSRLGKIMTRYRTIVVASDLSMNIVSKKIE
ncbi:MAG: hypothetical protein CO042_01070 [Parcubacteria group bacterium CG_4_9_14_0_2_um_filter_41_8]|nr:MAG: hypothetical protein AUJ34_01860 [Parcubacteria group bacterium CG1_02_41_12]PIP66843.1 MAG: hypothetical protein COW93_03475 [Parcubacteria group bacterium CG22_combo_CG10-13_8_21_14_all_41_9]PIQ80458.1 MAG: hypothetical protein COV79_00365 [Parcubacteria group bacterium CG11_big_fil_rev_8_21_14_0_20_41_14]PIR57595.1 MAG: hypothetical protein COU72_00135 [Parcubacteria group bacterium CG10_big_fil_rev_8_21_14_0_10_41_35]PJC40942.1 MAG: hypothetical protein CO042_01070 [Parcubacteria gr